MRALLGETFASLEVQPFRILWFGTILSFVGFFMSTVVQSVVAFKLVGTNQAVGYVVFTQGIAMALLGPIGGALADRWPKRRVIVAGQLTAATVFAGLGTLLAMDSLGLGLLATGSLLIGATFAFLGPARQALVIDLVPEDQRGNAMAINNVANTGSRVLGPAIAGALLGWELAGPAGAYWAIASLYVFSALSVSLLPKSKVRLDAGARPVLSDVGDGLSYVWHHPRLRVLVGFFVAVILVGFPHVTLLPGLLENVFERDAVEVSQLYLSSAVGAVLASVGVARFADSRRASLIYTALAVSFGVGLVATAAATSYWVVVLAMFIVGAASGGFQSLNGAVIARESEPQYIGRVLSLTILAFAGFGLMALPLGVLADWVGERPTLASMGTGVVLLGVALAWSLRSAGAAATTIRRTP